MGFLKKYSFWLISAGILLLFLITRLYHILSLPIFTDESIYVRWAQIAKEDASWRFISLTDGKQPLYIWFAMILMKFIKDPLLASRMVSVLSGLVTTVGLYILTLELFKDKKAALLASLIYVISPFALVYDKMALYDSLVASFTVWCLYLEILLVKYRRLDLAFLLGLVAGGAILTKSNAFFSLALLPFSLLLFNNKQKQQTKQLGWWAVLAAIVVLLANLYYAILRLSPFFHVINEKNHVFIYSFSDWIHTPFAFFLGNFHSLISWFIIYVTVPIALLIVAAFLINKKLLLQKLLLLSWFLIPFIYLAFFGKVIYPRYILFMVVPLFPLAAFTLSQFFEIFRPKLLQYLCILVFLVYPLGADFLVISDFINAPIPQSDKSQYLTGWPSGVGVKETVQFLETKAQDGKIYVATEGTFGLMPYALEIYLHKNPNIKTVGIWPIKDTPPVEVIQASKIMPTYFVFYQGCPSCKAIGIAPESWKMKEIMQFKKEKGSYYTLYQVMP